MSSVGAFDGLIMYFFTFENWSPFILIVWEMTVTRFSVKLQLRLKNFT